VKDRLEGGLMPSARHPQPIGKPEPWIWPYARPGG
jgi:hypothetical protein